jgi:hypothetical protein
MPTAHALTRCFNHIPQACRLKSTPRECFNFAREAVNQPSIRGDWHTLSPGYHESTKDLVMFNGAHSRPAEQCGHCLVGLHRCCAAELASDSAVH